MNIKQIDQIANILMENRFENIFDRLFTNQYSIIGFMKMNEMENLLNFIF